MADQLGAIGLLFFIFFMVAAATEALLEIFRGTLERFGLTFLKSAYNLDDAARLATEFVPQASEVRGKLIALKAAVERTKTWRGKTRATVASIAKAFQEALDGTTLDDTAIAQLNSTVATARSFLESNERRRVFTLRLISIGIAIVLCYWADVDALRLMVQGYPNVFNGTGLAKLAEAGIVGIVVTGISAASGSSYWHDQLDKVRNMKGLADQLRQAGRP